MIHHHVDGVLQLEEFTFDIDRDFLGQVAIRDRSCDGGNIAHLRGQIAGHQVHVLGQILPGSGHAFDFGLAAELALRSDFARHPRHLGSERAELIDHGVDRLGRAQKFALQLPPFDIRRHRLREIAFGDGADDTRHVARGMNQVADQFIDRTDRVRPAIRDVAQ